MMIEIVNPKSIENWHGHKISQKNNGLPVNVKSHLHGGTRVSQPFFRTLAQSLIDQSLIALSLQKQKNFFSKAWHTTQNIYAGQLMISWINLDTWIICVLSCPKVIQQMEVSLPGHSMTMGTLVWKSPI